MRKNLSTNTQATAADAPLEHAAEQTEQQFKQQAHMELMMRRPQGPQKLNEAGDGWEFDQAANDAHATEALATIAAQNQADHTALKTKLIKACDPVLRQYRNATEFGLKCNISEDDAAQVAEYQNALYDWHVGQPTLDVPAVLTRKESAP